MIAGRTAASIWAPLESSAAPQRLGLAVEVFVEGRLRDRGGGGDVGDRRRRVALGGDRDGEAADDPLFGAVGGEGRRGRDRARDDQPAGAAQRPRRRREAHRPLPEAGDEVGQLRLAALAQAAVDHLVEAADDPAQQLRRHRRAVRHLLGGVADEQDDPVDRPLDLVDPGGARGVGLDQAHPRRGGLFDDQLDEGFERRAGAVVGIALAVELVGDRGDPGGDHLVLGGAEAGELVVELFVEGGAGDARGAEQILDRGRVVAFFVTAGDEGGEEPLALVTPRRVPIAAAAGWQPAISQGVRVSPRGLEHQRDLIPSGKEDLFGLEQIRGCLDRISPLERSENGQSIRRDSAVYGRSRTTKRSFGSSAGRDARTGKFGSMPYPLANALYQWEEGARALDSIDDPKLRRLADRVISAIRLELRRRVGPTFTAEELADFYGQGTDWAQQIAIDVAPAAADDAHSLADAAFWSYLRGAGNFAGGRTLAQ